MPESRSKIRRLLIGAAIGFFIGLLGKELDLPTLVSYHGDRADFVLLSLGAGALFGLARLERLLVVTAAAGACLWLLVTLTPMTAWMGEGLVREDRPEKSDAIFVLSSGLQPDGELSTAAMSRLLGGLELLNEGWAPRLVLSELPLPYPRYRAAACELMDSLGMSQEVLVVGPVLNTHDEAVAVGELARDVGIERLLVVTSPSHSLRASRALEAQGLEVVSVPSVETEFDYQNLGANVPGDDRVRAFGAFIHELVGLWYYRHQGWIR